MKGWGHERPWNIFNGTSVSLYVKFGYIGNSSSLEFELTFDTVTMKSVLASNAGAPCWPYPSNAGAPCWPYPSNTGAPCWPYPSNAGAPCWPYPSNAGAPCWPYLVPQHLFTSSHLHTMQIVPCMCLFSAPWSPWWTPSTRSPPSPELVKCKWRLPIFPINDF